MTETVNTPDLIAELVAAEMVKSAAPTLTPEVIDGVYAVAHASLSCGNTEEARVILDWLGMSGNRSAGVDEARAYIAMSDGAYDVATCLYAEAYRQNPADPELLILAFQAAYRMFRRDEQPMDGLIEWMDSCRDDISEDLTERFEALHALAAQSTPATASSELNSATTT